MKNRIEVMIAGNRFTMAGEQDEEYMTKIAELIDSRISKIRETGMNLIQATTLTACDMADNYVQAVQGAENLRSQISTYLDENKSLTQELADARKEIDTLQKSPEGSDQQADKKHIAELEKQLAEAKMRIQRMGKLEKQLAEVQSRAGRVSGLEKQLAEAQTRVEGMAKLEKQLKEAQQRGERVNELEKQLAEANTHIQNLEKKLAESKIYAERVREVEQQMAEVQAQHRTQTDTMNREIEQLRQKAEKGKKAQQRVDEMEQELSDAKATLNEMNTRLSRLFK